MQFQSVPSTNECAAENRRAAGQSAFAKAWANASGNIQRAPVAARARPSSLSNFAKIFTTDGTDYTDEELCLYIRVIREIRGPSFWLWLRRASFVRGEEVWVSRFAMRQMLKSSSGAPRLRSAEVRIAAVKSLTVVSPR